MQFTEYELSGLLALALDKIEALKQTDHFSVVIIEEYEDLAYKIYECINDIRLRMK